VFKAPKSSRSARTVPRPQVTLEHLRQHEVAQKAHRLSQRAEFGDHDLMFPAPDGEPWAPRRVTKAFASLGSKASIRKFLNPRATPCSHH
jgi:hypothetical protein